MRVLLAILGSLGLMYSLARLTKVRARGKFTDAWWNDQSRREGRLGVDNVRIKFPLQRKP